MTAAFLLAGAVLLVAFGGLMAAIDAAFGVTSRSDIEEMGLEGRNARQLTRIAADPDAHVNAVAFIRVLAETAAAVLVTVAFSILFENIWWAMLAAAVLMTGISFVLVGASPRSFGRHHSEGMLRANAPVVRGLRIILGPLAQGLVVLGNRVTPGRGRSSFTSEEQLLSMVDEAASNDLIEADDRDLIHSVFDFTDQFVRAVMVPRTEMVTVDATATTSEAMTLFLQRGVSRMPVVDDDADDVVGVLYLKDLVLFAFRDENAWRTASIRPISRPATFVPESMRAETLLQQMKRDAVHVCLVIDEHGGISGLVTLEDLIEELVGEISDEYDQVSAEVVELGDGRYRVSSRLSLEDVGDLFGLELEDEDVDSIGGLLGKALGQVPQPGSTATVEGLTLTGGASRGRGRGIATVFVERAAHDADDTADERDGNDD
ncbi:CBS domain containing-hemolysin-like protein [Microbacterium phyllosphaerae]|uniref:CBS domain containing-hemolysin-like protein n=1 Tax=Microbacterium phyllosphaerae TaxID=124798 RepID=A0ABS4WS79_9MICO|nr:hemolysin family protein [Microbacterium phyllosphaerae]MBP2379071.1 CBS domain containing-hemolysin-like protein [Microbacterium phyllosphaerae]MCS3444406.1 CBS domain containing-hemolysin-like protein [Microbacterium phyllosphaerae]